MLDAGLDDAVQELPAELREYVNRWAGRVDEVAGALGGEVETEEIGPLVSGEREVDFVIGPLGVPVDRVQKIACEQRALSREAAGQFEVGTMREVPGT